MGEDLGDARLYIEHNATDEDTGVHGIFGGEAWSVLCIWDPTGELILYVDPRAQFNDLAVSDLFFESREPPAEEYSVSEVMADFPEGEYVVAGIDYTGSPRVDAAVFTHSIPAEPEITAPQLAEDEETAGDFVAARSGFVVTWEPVVETIAGETVEITAYEVIVTKVEHEDPNSLSRPVYDVHVPGSQLAMSVPGDFLEPETMYELEVLAIEASGNQTISVGFLVSG